MATTRYMSRKNRVMKNSSGKNSNVASKPRTIGKAITSKQTEGNTKRSSRVQPPLLFISYSHVDEECRKRLRIHLKPLERAEELRVFDDTELNRDTGWRDQLMKQLSAAKLVILLVSPDFLASDFCFVQEWPIARERWKQRKATVTFALIEPCQWKETDIGELQGVPSHGHLLPDDRRGAAEFWDKITTKLRRDAANH